MKNILHLANQTQNRIEKDGQWGTKQYGYPHCSPTMRKESTCLFAEATCKKCRKKVVKDIEDQISSYLGLKIKLSATGL